MTEPAHNEVDSALNVVVYSEPGPADHQIDEHSRVFLHRKTVSGNGGVLGYLLLVPFDFDRLWAGVEKGDAMGTAFAVLHFLGTNAHQFICREKDFVYGWVGDNHATYDRMLILKSCRGHTWS